MTDTPPPKPLRNQNMPARTSRSTRATASSPSRRALGGRKGIARPAAHSPRGPQDVGTGGGGGACGGRATGRGRVGVGQRGERRQLGVPPTCPRCVIPGQVQTRSQPRGGEGRGPGSVGGAYRIRILKYRVEGGRGSEGLWYASLRSCNPIVQWVCAVFGTKQIRRENLPRVYFLDFVCNSCKPHLTSNPHMINTHVRGKTCHGSWQPFDQLPSSVFHDIRLYFLVLGVRLESSFFVADGSTDGSSEKRSNGLPF